MSFDFSDRFIDAFMLKTNVNGILIKFETTYLVRKETFFKNDLEVVRHISLKAN